MVGCKSEALSEGTRSLLVSPASSLEYSAPWEMSGWPVMLRHDYRESGDELGCIIRQIVRAGLALIRTGETLSIY